MKMRLLEVVQGKELIIVVNQLFKVIAIDLFNQ